MIRVDSLTVVSFLFGSRSGAEGICTQRLVNSLRAKGITTTVITSSRSKIDANQPIGINYLPAYLSRPTRLQCALSQLIFGAWVPYADWVLRCARVRLHRTLVYARSCPLTSLIAGQQLANRWRLPLAIHFSDPIPCPWTPPYSMSATRERATVKQLLERALLITFTTDEAIDYAADIYGTHIKRKALCLPNIVPEPPEPMSVPRKAMHDLVYIGTFGGPRTPLSLASGLRLFNERAVSRGHTTLDLTLIGPNATWREQSQAILGPFGQVTQLPFTDDPWPHYRSAAIAVVVDADDRRPVFLPTKAGEACQVARRVLFVSPPRSPARRLFERGFRSVCFAEHDPCSIAHSIELLMSAADHDCDTEMVGRRQLLSPFRADAVAQRFLGRLEQDGIATRSSTPQHQPTAPIPEVQPTHSGISGPLCVRIV